MSSPTQRLDLARVPEQAPTQVEDGGTTTETCRLHSLNLYCLLHICKYLSMWELLDLYSLDDYFKSIIIDHVAATKLIDFTQTAHHRWTTNRIFRTFGKKMRRIKICRENTSRSFRSLLKFIIECCTPEQLTELHLHYSRDHEHIDRHLVERVMPYFKNVQKLVLNSCWDVMDIFAEASDGIKILHLHSCTLLAAWTEIASLNNLVEFRMHNSRETNCIEHLADFLRTKHNLEIFDYSGREHIAEATQVLSEECRNLLVYRNLYQKEYDAADGNPFTRISYLSFIPTIKHLAITSYSNQGNDIHYTLGRLSRSRIESLTIQINANGKDDANDITMIKAAEAWLADLTNRSFEQLTQIELFFISNESSTHTFQCDVLCKFLMRLPNLTTIRVKGDQCLGIRNISKILSYLPHIRRVSLASARLLHMPAEIRKIYKSLRELRTKQPKNKHMIHLGLNRVQMIEIMVSVFFYVVVEISK